MHIFRPSLKVKTPVKFQKDRTETVGGVKGTKYPLKTRNHAPRTTENQKQCPSTFLRKGGGQKKNVFPSDVERTVDAKSKSLIHLSINVQKINKESNLTDFSYIILTAAEKCLYPTR